MPLFNPDSRTRSKRNRRIYALYEIWYTAVDFAAAGCFVAGSVLFFYEATLPAARWLFVSGSLLFAAKPSIRLLRELRYLGNGDLDTLIERRDGRK